MFGLSQTVSVYLIVGLIALGGLAGWKGRDALCDAAEARAALAVEELKREKAELELKGYKESNGTAAKVIDALKDLKDKQDAGLKDLQDYLTKQPPGAVCVAHDDMVRRLLAIAR